MLNNMKFYRSLETGYCSSSRAFGHHWPSAGVDNGVVQMDAIKGYHMSLMIYFCMNEPLGTTG